MPGIVRVADGECWLAGGDAGAGAAGEQPAAAGSHGGGTNQRQQRRQRPVGAAHCGNHCRGGGGTAVRVWGGLFWAVPLLHAKPGTGGGGAQERSRQGQCGSE